VEGVVHTTKKPDALSKPTAETLVAKARAMIPAIAGRAAEARRERRISPETISDMEVAGFFRILQPARWGGYEMKPQVFYDVLIALAEGDMSAGWVYGVLGVHPWLMGLMDDRAVHDVWADDDTTRLCSSLMPAGRAEPVQGGFRLTGHWRFSSGCEHAKWALPGAAVRSEPGGTPDIRLFMVPRAEYQIRDTWFVSGLCATGSQDILVSETFVPSYRTRAKLTGADVAALYGFFMKEVPPVYQENSKNGIPWLLSFRWPLAIWSFLFTASGSYVAKSDHDADWNRGAYLVQVLGHCGACHTPRGLAFQEKALDEDSAAYLSGALLDAWYASNLRGDVRTGLGGWSKDDLADFLKNGHNRGETAFGSMIDVVNNSTAYLSDGDIEAIAVYLKSLPATTNQQPVAYDDTTTAALHSGHASQPGATVYTGTCANRHGFNGKGFGPYMPALAGNPVVLHNDTSSLSSTWCSTVPIRWSSRARRMLIACRNSASSTPIRRSPTFSHLSATAGATKRRRSRPSRSPNYGRRQILPAIRSSS
jgi:mono/diheme cytochrome c family protein